MKVFRFSIFSTEFFGEDYDTKESIANEIAERLGIDPSEVCIETEEYVEEEEEEGLL